MNVERNALRVYQTLLDDGLAVVPTSAGYGLLAMGRRGVERIYALKGRPSSKPCITVTTWPIFDDVAQPIDAPTRRWIDQTIRWTPLAVVAPIRPQSRLLAEADPFVVAQCTQAGTVATFHRAGALVTRVAALALADGRLVVGSSGNRSGTGNAYTLDEVPARAQADLVVDVGPIPIPGGARLATTILDLGTGLFLREGLHFDRIARSWERHQRQRDPGAPAPAPHVATRARGAAAPLAQPAASPFRPDTR